VVRGYDEKQLIEFPDEWFLAKFQTIFQLEFNREIRELRNVIGIPPGWLSEQSGMFPLPKFCFIKNWLTNKANHLEYSSPQRSTLGESEKPSWPPDEDHYRQPWTKVS
jgi:hypothetical protein